MRENVCFQNIQTNTCKNESVKPVFMRLPKGYCRNDISPLRALTHLAFHKHVDDPRIPEVIAGMETELGEGNKKPEILAKLAQYELTLLDWIEDHKGSRKYVALSGKCWPAFQTQFGFVPCYVNSRLTGRGIPVSCEVDLYGTLSEYIGQCVSKDAVTLLDINNTVTDAIYNEDIRGKFDYRQNETFMGFHCGNTCSSRLYAREMKNQMIMARSLPEEVTNRTLEGDIIPGDIAFYRIRRLRQGMKKSTGNSRRSIRQ